METQDNVITQEDLIQRIEDWKKRISDLYNEISRWLPEGEGYEVHLDKSIRMYEECMQKYNIDPTMLDAADILKDKQVVLTIKPYGLWVIGTNGRLDLLNQNGVIFLIDLSEQFHNPKWMLVDPSQKRAPIPFSKSTLLKVVGK